MIGVQIACAIEFQIPETIPTSPFQALETALEMSFHRSDSHPAIESTMLRMAPVTAFQAELATPVIEFQIEDAVDLMPSHIPDRKLAIEFQTDCAVELIVFQTDDRNEVIAFQADDTPEVMVVQS